MPGKYSEKEKQRIAKHQIKVRLNDEELKILEELEKPFLNRSYYVKHRILNFKLKPPAPVINKDSFLSLGKIGTNINQIARRVNSSEANIFHRATRDELMKEIDTLSKILNQVLDNMKKNKI